MFYVRFVLVMVHILYGQQIANQLNVHDKYYVFCFLANTDFLPFRL